MAKMWRNLKPKKCIFIWTKIQKLKGKKFKYKTILNFLNKYKRVKCFRQTNYTNNCCEYAYSFDNSETAYLYVDGKSIIYDMDYLPF
jgi:hypothetical protein